MRTGIIQNFKKRRCDKCNKEWHTIKLSIIKHNGFNQHDEYQLYCSQCNTLIYRTNFEENI